MISVAELLLLRGDERILVFAPHPDDESIACAGILLAARDAGALRRVVVVTDGDNNPWPQRWIEKRLRIDAAARQRWGARRRAEAQRSLALLGVEPAQSFFLGLPDAELTDLLMRNDVKLCTQIAAQLAAFEPTHILVPDLEDRHPDHSALHVAVEFALQRPRAPRIELLSFAVHGKSAGADVRLCLDQAHIEIKRQAILQHETQMRLSGSRFLKFAAANEFYRSHDAQALPEANQTGLTAIVGPDRTLALRIGKTTYATEKDSKFLLAMEADDGSSLRAYAHLSGRAQLHIQFTSGGETVQVSMPLLWRDESAARVAEVQLPAWRTLTKSGCVGFVKLEKLRRGLSVFDRHGWRVVRFA